MSPETFLKFNKMNHDLRTQLTVVVAGVHLLGQDPIIAAKYPEYFKRMCRSIEKAESILDLAYEELRRENE